MSAGRDEYPFLTALGRTIASGSSPDSRRRQTIRKSCPGVRYAIVQIRVSQWALASPAGLTDPPVFLLFPAGSHDKRSYFLHQFSEHTKRNLLRAVAQSFSGIRMNFNQQCIGSHRNRAFAH